MKTTAYQDDLLYDLIKDSTLDTLLNGGIYKGERPLDSKSEDIVIGSMLIGDGTLQSGVANVNIYIPKIQQNIGGKMQTLKNTLRCSQVLPVAMEILKESFYTNGSLWCSHQQDFDEPDIQQTRLSFRIEFRLDSST